MDSFFYYLWDDLQSFWKFENFTKSRNEDWVSPFFPTILREISPKFGVQTLWIKWIFKTTYFHYQSHSFAVKLSEFGFHNSWKGELQGHRANNTEITVKVMLMTDLRCCWQICYVGDFFRYFFFHFWKLCEIIFWSFSSHCILVFIELLIE